nr:proton-conducting transporter membrane subunit [Rubellimicrobium sp. CFH 75288]
MVSRDLFNLYVGLELLTLTAVAMVALGRGPGAIEAALRYVLYALMGSLVYLLGVVLVYHGHGTLDLDRIAAGRSGADALALGLMTAGLAIKTALFPFHAWLPPAHAGAPSPASALLSALVPKAGFVMLVRLWFEAMPDATPPAALAVMAALGAGAILHGGLMALRQERLKQILAYSTVAQLGYLFVMFPLVGGAGAGTAGAAEAWAGTQIGAFSHALAKAAVFLCAALWIRAIGSDRLADLAGLARAMPLSCFAFGMAAVSLMGLPPSGGFIAKYLVMRASFELGLPGWGLVLAAGGLLAAAYFYRPLAALFAREPPRVQRTPRLLEAVPLALALAAAALGVLSQPAYDLLQAGAPAYARGIGP